MSDDPNNPGGHFTSPASQVEALSFPDNLWEQLKELYGQTLPEGQSGGMEVTGLRLSWHLPSGLDTEGVWEEREGWVKCKCALTGSRFALPEGEPVPALETEYRFDDSTESVFHQVVHPELAADRPRLAERLVAGLGRKVHDRFLDLIGTAAKLRALSEMEELPVTSEGEPSTQPPSGPDYEPVDDIPE